MAQSAPEAFDNLVLYVVIAIVLLTAVGGCNGFLVSLPLLFGLFVAWIFLKGLGY